MSTADLGLSPTHFVNPGLRSATPEIGFHLEEQIPDRGTIMAG
jgi:hypothetical protein